MTTVTDEWHCYICGGAGHQTYDSRPWEGCPEEYGECDDCGYQWGIGNGVEYSDIKPLHDLNSIRFEILDYMGEGRPTLTEEEYRKIIVDAGTPALIEENTFADEHCRVARPNKMNTWCLYCKDKGNVVSGDFLNWTDENPLEVKG